MMIIGLKSNPHPVSITIEFKKDGVMVRDSIVTSGGMFGPNLDIEEIKNILEERYKGSIIKNIEIKDWGYMLL